MASASGHQTPKSQQECGLWRSATRRGQWQARTWGLLQSMAPTRPAHHQPSTWLPVARGLHSLNLAQRGAPDAAASMTKFAGLRMIVRRTATRECFVNQRVRAAAGADTETAYLHSHRCPVTTTSHRITIYGPKSAHPSAPCRY